MAHVREKFMRWRRQRDARDPERMHTRGTSSRGIPDEDRGWELAI